MKKVNGQLYNAKEIKEYKITIFDYELDGDGVVIDRDGGTMVFKDADEFIEKWNYFKETGPAKEITDNGEILLMTPIEIENEHYVTDYQVSGDGYELLKKWDFDDTPF